MFAPGQILRDRYELQRCLRENPGRETWLAQDLQAKEPVVVKLLLFGGPVQWQDIRLFEREVEVLEQLDRPRIPAYRDRFSLEDRTPTYLGLVQEYVKGESLQECLDRGRHFQEKDLQAIAKQVLDILIYLHELQPPILHRDIKPSNLMRDGEGRIYLIDFGSVQTANAVPGRSFTVAGTYGYTPMEQFGGQAVPASDLYALGCTLIHLATGQLPANLTQRDGRIDVAAITTLSAGFAQWIQQLCEPHVGQRPESARAAIALAGISFNRDIAKPARAAMQLFFTPQKDITVRKEESRPSLSLQVLLQQPPNGVSAISEVDTATIQWQPSIVSPEATTLAIAVIIPIAVALVVVSGWFFLSLLPFLLMILLMARMYSRAKTCSTLILRKDSFSLTKGIEASSYSGEQLPTLLRCGIASIKVVDIIQRKPENSDSGGRCGVIEVQTKSGRCYSFSVHCPQANTATVWLVKVLGLWANVPICLERETGGRRTLMDATEQDLGAW